MTTEAINFEKDYRGGFEFLTALVRSLDCLKAWVFQEYVMPDGSIERWFIGHEEYFKLTYRSHRKP